jgi:hypothetical protein
MSDPFDDIYERALSLSKDEQFELGMALLSSADEPDGVEEPEDAEELNAAEGPNGAEDLDSDPAWLLEIARQAQQFRESRLASWSAERDAIRRGLYHS